MAQPKSEHVPEYTQEEIEGDCYSWRNRHKVDKHGNKKIKFFVYTINCPVGQQGYNKKPEPTGIDIDYEELKKGFMDHHLVEPSHFFPISNINKEELGKEFDKLKGDERIVDKLLETYDCFCFVFLTYSSVEGGQKMLHLHDAKVPLEYIWELASNIPPIRGKPKIFLIQADDVSLVKDHNPTKGPDRAEGLITRSIPTDADRITIMSTIPRAGYAEEGQPSFLIQAFLNVMERNWELSKEKKQEDKQGKEQKDKPEDKKEPEDFLSLTVEINAEVKRLIDESKGAKIEHNRNKLQIPEVISTLSKLLYIYD